MKGLFPEALGYDSSYWTFGYTDTSRGQQNWSSSESSCANAKLATGNIFTILHYCWGEWENCKI